MDKIEEQLSKLVLKGIEIAEQTGEFAIEQAPLLLKEFYTWHIIENIFMSIVYLFSMLLIGHLTKMLGKKEIDESLKKDYILRKGLYFKTDYAGDSDSYGVYLTINIIKYILLVGVFIHLYDLLFIIVAPKLYLVEYFIR